MSTYPLSVPMPKPITTKSHPIAVRAKKGIATYAGSSAKRIVKTASTP